MMMMMKTTMVMMKTGMMTMMMNMATILMMMMMKTTTTMTMMMMATTMMVFFSLQPSQSSGHVGLGQSLNCGGKVRREFDPIHMDCYENIADIPQLLMAFHLLSLGVLQALHHRPGPSSRQRHRLKMLCGPLV